MSDFPNLRVQLNGLGRKIEGAIFAEAQELEAAVREAVNALATEGRLHELVRVEVEKGIEEAIRRACSHPTVEQAIRGVVIQALAKGRDR